MRPDEWDRIRQLFHDALDLPPEDRQAFLSAACNDPGIRAEVEDLLATEQQESDILSGPAWDGLPGVIEAAVPASHPPRPSSSGSQAHAAGRDSLASGTILKGRYRLERQLGQGGFGAVFLATDQQLHSRPVVVKALLEENSRDPWFQARFGEEIRTLAAIDHPGVVAILDSGQTADGDLFLVMQFAEGATLRSLIPPEGMAFDRAAGLVRQMAEALAAAHGKGVIHQDLKPENVMVQRLSGEQEHVRLIDFGIARLKSNTPESGSRTDVSRVAGSPSYMAPEHLSGRASLSSDIYSLGVVAYEMLTGRKPLDAQNPVQLYQMQSRGEIVPPRSLRPDLPQRAERALLHALAFQPDDRPASALDFAQELGEALAPGKARATAESSTRATSSAPRALAHDVFISYASRDREVAARLVKALELHGIRCFISCRDLQPDDVFPVAVGDAITNSGCCALLLTEAANGSVQVSRDVQLARANAIPVLAVRFDGVRASEELAFFLGQAPEIDAFSDLAEAELERIERAIRAHVPRAPGPPVGESAPILPPRDAGEPLFSEFGRMPKFLRPGLRRVRVISIFALWALFTCVISAIANTAYITVSLQGPEPQSTIPVRFGYLYELNAALAYLLVVPWFVYFAMGFVMQAQVALASLASRDQIVPNRLRPLAGPGLPIPSPLELVAVAHRRWMGARFWVFAFVLGFLVVVGTEFLPPKSDYEHVMFGYVQAPWVAEYPVRCPGCTLRDLERRLERRIEPQGRLSRQQLEVYRIAEPYYRRKGAIQRIAFGLFIVSVLGIELAFALFILWTVFNAFFFLRLIYRAIAPSASSVIGLHLRYTDPSRIFGLDPIHRALRQLVATICVSTILPVVSWWTNVMKGSRRALGQDLYSLGGWGQFLISNGSFVMAAALLVYLVSISGKARDAANEQSKHAMELPRSGRGLGRMDEFLALISEQSVWRKMGYTVPYLAAPFLCVLAVLLLERVGLADSVGNAWEEFLRSILGMR